MCVHDLPVAGKEVVDRGQVLIREARGEFSHGTHQGTEHRLASLAGLRGRHDHAAAPVAAVRVTASVPGCFKAIDDRGDSSGRQAKRLCEVGRGGTALTVNDVQGAQVRVVQAEPLGRRLIEAVDVGAQCPEL